jgi:hypothetical protein
MRINKTDSALLRGYGKPKRLSTDGTDVLSLADLESHLHISLLPEPSSISVPLLILRHPLQIESLQNKRNKLAHLHDGNILPNARAGAVAELKRTQLAISHMTCCIQKQDITYYQHRSLHEFQLRGIRLQPSLWPVYLRIFTKDIRINLHHWRHHRHVRSRREGNAA